jgi:hypothetical protein
VESDGQTTATGQSYKPINQSQFVLKCRANYGDLVESDGQTTATGQSYKPINQSKFVLKCRTN